MGTLLDLYGSMVKFFVPDSSNIHIFLILALFFHVPQSLFLLLSNDFRGSIIMYVGCIEVPVPLISIPNSFYWDGRDCIMESSLSMFLSSNISYTLRCLFSFITSTSTNTATCTGMVDEI